MKFAEIVLGLFAYIAVSEPGYDWSVFFSGEDSLQALTDLEAFGQLAKAKMPAELVQLKTVLVKQFPNPERTKVKSEFYGIVGPVTPSMEEGDAAVLHHAMLFERQNKLKAIKQAMEDVFKAPMSQLLTPLFFVRDQLGAGRLPAEMRILLGFPPRGSTSLKPTPVHVAVRMPTTQKPLDL